jgi:hypothetical protein
MRQRRRQGRWLPIETELLGHAKVTDPVGVPLAKGATVAVKVTDWPVVAANGLMARVVVVAACVTVSDPSTTV